MQTYLYIHKENTSGPQDRYRGKYPLKHVDYELSRAVGRKGDVLDISVDIRYGYQVSSMLDTLCFSPQAREYGYTPLSKREWYKAIDNVNSIVDNIGESLVHNSGKARVGSNFHVYVENPYGRVFRGNQHVKTYGLEKIGKGVGRVAMPIAVYFEGHEISDGFQQDGRNWGYNTEKQIAGGIGGVAGGMAGAWAGAKVLGTFGSLFGPIGGLAGLIIGGFVGSYFGSEYSEEGIEYLYDEIKR